MQSARNSWEGRCSAARLPHKKVREELRDTNFSPLTARKIYRLAPEGVSKFRCTLWLYFYKQSPDFHKPGLCHVAKFLYLCDIQ